MLVSVLALLAFACAPALVQAETVYEPEETNLPDTKSPSKHNTAPDEKSPKAHASEDPAGDGGSEQDESSEENKASAGNPSTPGGGSEAQGKGGEGAKVANKQPGGSVQNAQPLATTTSTDDESSSPLVPILIAVAVLAAISVGAVLYRQRRGGSRFSPNAS